MSQAVWTGSISFGLVSIPVKLYPATEPKDVRFHLYDRRTGKRVRYERVTRGEDPVTFRPEPTSRVFPEERAESSTPAPVGSAPFRQSPVAAAAVASEAAIQGRELPTRDLVPLSEGEH